LPAAPRGQTQAKLPSAITLPGGADVGERVAVDEHGLAFEPDSPPIHFKVCAEERYLPRSGERAGH